MASGVEVEIQVREGYKDMINNMSLARRFGAHRRASLAGHASLGHGRVDLPRLPLDPCAILEPPIRHLDHRSTK